MNQHRVRAVQADLRERGRFALHNGVAHNAGTGGEASVSGTGLPVDDDADCNWYGDVTLPERRRWRADP